MKVLLWTINSIASFAFAPHAAAQQLAYFNHFYIVTDQAQADAIANSEPLAEFGPLSVKTVEAGEGRSWTGRYLMGRQTYLEVFGPDDLGPDRIFPGALGIALSGDTPGVADRIYDRLKQAGANPYRDMQRRRLDTGEEVDWYVAVGVEGPEDSGMYVWVMEYVPEYVASRKEAAESEDDLISRERYNSDDYLQHVMRDITALNARVRRRDLEVVLPTFEAAGFSIDIAEDGAIVTGRDMTFTFEVVPFEEVGLAAIDFTLNDLSTPTGQFDVGRSVVELQGDGRARWTFEPFLREEGPLD